MTRRTTRRYWALYMMSPSISTLSYEVEEVARSCTPRRGNQGNGILGTVHIRQWWCNPTKCETRVGCMPPSGERRCLPLPPHFLEIFRLTFSEATITKTARKNCRRFLSCYMWFCRRFHSLKRLPNTIYFVGSTSA